MKASRKGPKGAFRRPFGLVLCGVVLMPTSIGYQDLAALIARQPAVTERWRAHVRSSAYSPIQATFSFARPIGSAIPDPYFTQLAALDPRALDVTGSVPLPAPIEPQFAAPTYDFPVVERRLKGDRLTVTKAPSGPAAPAKQPVAAPPKLKDQASLTPGPKPAPLPASLEPAVDAQQAPAAVARKGDKAKPAPVPAPKPLATQVGDAALDRAAIAAEQIGQGARAAGSVPRKPAVVAEKPAPLEPKPLPSSPVRKAEKPKPVATPANDAALQRAGRAAEQVAQSTQAVQAAAAAPRKPAEIAQPPMSEPVPQVAPEPQASLPQTAMRAPTTEIADVESDRADIHGPLVLPPVPVAEAPPVQAAPQPQAPAVAQNAPAQMAPLESAPPAKQIDRFEAIDSLAQYSTPGRQTTRIYFGTHEIGFGKGTLQRWEPDEIPTVLAAPHVDPEIKRAALDPLPEIDAEAPGETVAPKGEVTGEGRRPRTPAERLNLVGATRVKHEKCLANAIYFEARGEVERGQMAVAQVILNRAFSGYYPGNVCDVVYQNAHRHLACQFTFACDNVRDVVKDQKAWSVATKVASEALDGKFWLPEIGKATHYHATYVNPWWVRTMTKHSKLGIHIFYRPKRWGDGEEIPVWGDKLDLTGSIKPMLPESDKDVPDKRAAAQPAMRRSIFDPVEEIKPGG
jgi:spore germination cell wall hydrolase CwlJ-like protein